MSNPPSGTTTTHFGSLTYSMLARGWYAKCSCGWESTHATDDKQEAADLHTDHALAAFERESHS